MADFRLGSMIAEMHGQGQGPAIVMIHGLGGSSNSFTPLMDYLSEYQVIRLDLPGAGRSAYQPGRVGIEGLATSVCELLNALDIKRACFVGHSMGTLISLRIAANKPELVSQLVLFGAILDLSPQARGSLQQRAEQARQQGMAAIADAVANASLGRSTDNRYAAAKAFVRESLLRQDPMGYAAHCMALAESTAIPHHQVKCPVSLIHGHDDPIATLANGKALASRLAQGLLTELTACGHWPMIEAAAESGSALQQALGANKDGR